MEEDLEVVQAEKGSRLTPITIGPLEIASFKITLDV
jgi:hypothetical protein